MFGLFLSMGDAARVRRVIDKLGLHGLRDFALTGSLALRAHLAARRQVHPRPLNDLDIVVGSFASVPENVAKAFLVRHVHPHAPEGKMLIQLVDAAEALRIDVFRAHGATLARGRLMSDQDRPFQVVSLEDLAARIASLLMDLARGMPVPRKHADDFRRLADLVQCDRVEVAWQDHRKPTDPHNFEEAVGRIRDLVVERDDLLVVPEYSQDVNALCPKCEETAAFRSAPATTVLSILGYC